MGSENLNYQYSQATVIKIYLNAQEHVSTIVFLNMSNLWELTLPITDTITCMDVI